MLTRWEQHFSESLDARYDIVRRIATGGTSSIYLARDRKHDRDVAIKVLDQSIVEDISADRFLREIRVVARLTHPNILPLLDSGEVASVPYYVMPYAEGSTLRERLAREGTIPIPAATRMAAEIADALQYAHAAGVIHRDIKPGNILMMSGHAVVTDFGAGLVNGLLRGDAPSTAEGLVIGTFQYMSPEQAMASPELDERTDQFSLGVVLFEMIAGALPFDGSRAQQVFAQRILSRAKSLRAVCADAPVWLEEVVARALSREPRDRFTSIDEFARALVPDPATDPSHPTIERNSGRAAMAHARAAGNGSNGTQAVPVVAVLPFESLSPDPADAYLATGLVEELTTALGRLRTLHVATPALTRGPPPSIQDVGARLGAVAVLAGSVRRFGTTIRVDARFIETATGIQRWADHFDDTTVDFLRAQETVAYAIARALDIELADNAVAPFGVRGTSSARARDAYLRARHAFGQRTELQLARAVELFEQAVDLDPDYAEAHAGLAAARLVLGVYGLRAPLEIAPAAKEAALRATELDPTSTEARATLASVLATFDWNWKDATEQFQRALTLRPGDVAVRQRFALDVLVPQRRFAEAIEHTRAAQALDPLSPVMRASVAAVLHAAGKHVEAVAECDRAIELEPNFGLIHYFRGQALMGIDAAPRALSSFRRAIELSGRAPEIVSALGNACAVTGDRTSALACRDELIAAMATRYVSSYLVAQIDIALGERDAALRGLERACREHAAELTWLNARIPFRDVHDDQRFTALLARIGIA